MKLEGKELYLYIVLNIIVLIVSITSFVDITYLNYGRNYLLYALLVLVAAVMIIENVMRIKAKKRVLLSILFLIIELVYITILTKFCLF